MLDDLERIAIDKEFDALKEKFSQLLVKFEALEKYYQELIPAFEAKQESSEFIVANLVQGYAELGVNIQSVMDVTFNSSEEMKVSLQKALKVNREKMFEVLNPDGEK